MLNPSIRVVAGMDPPKDGDFGIRLESDVVAVPAAFERIVGAYHVRTGPQLVAVFETFPTEVSRDLGWTREQVVAATSRLASCLGLETKPSEPTAAPTPSPFGAFRPLRPGRQRRGTGR